MSEGCSTSACNEVQEPNHRDSLPDYAHLSEISEHRPLRDENEVAEENKELPEEEDEDEDVDFNPFLKDNNSVEASSSLSSEVEDLDTDVADSREISCTAFDGDYMEKERDNIRDSQISGNVDHGENTIAIQTAFSPEEVSATTIHKESVVITPSENEFICDEENEPATQPMVDMDDSEGAICMRTRARYSLASFTLDELETFLQESDDENDLQNVDDEEEYRKFLAGVLRGDDSQNLTENANVDEEDEENDADFELELEEALESEPEEVEERRVTTRRIRCQKSSLERSKKLSGKSNRPLRPLLPYTTIGSFPAYDGNHIMPNMAPSYVPPVNNGTTCVFTPHQIGQLHCLIHEHVQLLIQVFSLSILEPGKSNIAAKVKELVVDMLKKRDQALTWRTVPHPSFCFFPPYVHPSVSDGLQRMLPPKESNGNVQQEISTTINRDLHADVVSLTSGRNTHQPDGLANSFQTPECSFWVPYVCGPKLSVVDVAPLRLLEHFIDDVSSAVRAYERHQIELGFESGCPKEPLFPLHNFPCSAGSDDQGEMENNPPDSSRVLSPSPSKQMNRKTMAANLLEKAKNQPIASVPKEIAELAQRFWPFFNPALYPHKPPPAAIVNRVLFTDAEDELLALGLMEYNTDWKAIQQRFLPCKSRHQIFVRQKNRASSKTPENPIKAVRRMKNSPLTSEEVSRIEMGIKRFKLDWVSIWRSFVPYRDPSLLPRQWRIACGTQKSYISDANKNAKRRLNNIRRKTSKPPPSTRHLSSEKEGDSTDNAVEDTNSGNRIDKEDEAYVHEAFLADWRPGDNNVSSSIPACMPTQVGSIQSSICSSSQVLLRPYRSRKQNSTRLVKLAPDLPPVNLPPSVRIMSQSAFKSSQAGPTPKTAVNASRNADQVDSSVKSGLTRNHPTDIQPPHSDLQMHPLLFQAPQDGRLPYYPVNGNSSTTSSFAFFPGKQPQLSLGLFHNPRLIRDAMNFLSKSSIPPRENASSPVGADFHPLLQRNDDVDTHSVGKTPACPIAESRQGCTSIQSPPLDGNSSASGKKDNELDLDIHLSFTSKNQKAVGNRCETGSLPSAKDSGKKRVFSQDGISDELNSGDIPRVTPRNKGSRKVSDATCDDSLPEIIMEQEELSDSEEEFGENVEFECEEMADSEGDSLSDSEQIVNIPSEEVHEEVEMGTDIDDAGVPKTRNDNGGNNTGSTSDGLLSRLESAGKGGVNIKTNVSSPNLNSCPPVSSIPNPKNVVAGYNFGPFGTSELFCHNQQPPASASSKGYSRQLKQGSPRNPRKRICRSNSNPSAVAESGKGKSNSNSEASVENMKNVDTGKSS